MLFGTAISRRNKDTFIIIIINIIINCSSWSFQTHASAKTLSLERVCFEHESLQSFKTTTQKGFRVDNQWIGFTESIRNVAHNIVGHLGISRVDRHRAVIPLTQWVRIAFRRCTRITKTNGVSSPAGLSATESLLLLAQLAIRGLADATNWYRWRHRNE